jgi:Tol biopolymer transport system component
VAFLGQLTTVVRDTGNRWTSAAIKPVATRGCRFCDRLTVELVSDSSTILRKTVTAGRRIGHYEISARTGEVTRRITQGYSGEMYPQLDPAGRSRLVFSSTLAGNRTLWLARPDGSQLTSLTGGDGIDDRPTFSRDGTRIAFVSGRGDRRGIWVMNSDGGSPKHVGDAVSLDTLS